MKKGTENLVYKQRNCWLNKYKRSINTFTIFVPVHRHVPFFSFNSLSHKITPALSTDWGKKKSIIISICTSLDCFVFDRWDWNIEMLTVLAEELSLQMLTIIYRAKNPPEPYNHVDASFDYFFLHYVLAFKTLLYWDPNSPDAQFCLHIALISSSQHFQPDQSSLM